MLILITPENRVADMGMIRDWAVEYNFEVFQEMRGDDDEASTKPITLIVKTATNTTPYDILRMTTKLMNNKGLVGHTIFE